MNPLALFSAYKNVILGSIIALLTIALLIQSYRINSCKADLANSTAQVAILSASIDTQNESINKMSADRIKREQEANEALSKANATNSVNNKKIAGLKSQIGKFKTCDEAVLNAKRAL